MIRKRKYSMNLIKIERQIMNIDVKKKQEIGLFRRKREKI